MKNILLLGNGFDLYYKLPTKYDNFLHVVSYLINNKREAFETVGDVFSNNSLQKSDQFVAYCYKVHQPTFDETPLRKDDISEIVKLTERNIWLSYLNKVYNKDVGWIDFEKEIGFVLKCFEKIFYKPTEFGFKGDELYVKYVLEIFEFFIQKVTSPNIVVIGTYKVNTEYCVESPLGSGNNIIDVGKVVKKLYKELEDLTKALKLYLKCFVENVLELLKNDGTCSRLEFLSHVEKTITFNYTNTYEKLYFNRSAFHIHGNVNDEIVLGVNPDEADNLETINTTFVSFKKYFQRTLFETDKDYLWWVKEFMDAKTPYRLFTMGHSLDITDYDIIAELFQNAKKIIVLYHNDDAKKSYISNLIQMFGKDGFDILKKDKGLTFISLYSDMSLLKAVLSEEPRKDIYATMGIEQGEEIVVV